MGAFIRVWLVLLALTAGEVWLAYLRAPVVIMLVLLLMLSIAKASCIISWFMHMRYEVRRLRLALFPILILLILSLFGVLPDAKGQCVMCQRTAAARNQARQSVLNRAIVLLLVPSLAAMAGILIHARRKEN